MIAKRIEIRGQMLTVKEMMAKYKDEIPPGIVRRHIISRYFSHGWPIEKALFKPLTVHPKKDLDQEKREQAERDKLRREKRKLESREVDLSYTLVMRAIKPLGNVREY